MNGLLTEHKRGDWSGRANGHKTMSRKKIRNNWGEKNWHFSNSCYSLLSPGTDARKIDQGKVNSPLLCWQICRLIAKQGGWTAAICTLPSEYAQVKCHISSCRIFQGLGYNDQIQKEAEAAVQKRKFWAVLLANAMGIKAASAGIYLFMKWLNVLAGCPVQHKAGRSSNPVLNITKMAGGVRPLVYLG